ncbi:MAG: hypothetical protein QOJ60_1578 [Actinomycetota bacterium]|nr:hypothetical protein [Actinomycetota bacterium]
MADSRVMTMQQERRTGTHRGGTRRVLPAPTATRWPREVALGAIWLSLAVVTSLWLRGGELQTLTRSGADAVTSLGRLSGLLAADLLLLQVLGMARVPWVERAFGQDSIARLHRLTGFGSVSLMLVHVLLITVGYAATGHTGVVSELVSLVLTYPGMLLAAAAATVLVGVAVTSVRLARRRLRYESWHLLHLYAYLGVGLALPHQIWTGADFVSSPLARAYWWTLYATVLGAVLTFRVARPLWRSLWHRVEVAAVVDEAPGVISLHLRGHRLDRLGLRAGQFLVWRFLDGPGWSRGHPFSISAAPHPRMLRITVKDLGDGSRDLRALRPGTRAMLEGPYGRLTGAVRTSPKVTLVAAGIGITPMRALLEEMPYAAGEAVLLYRARSERDLVFRAELDGLAADRGASVVYLIGRRGKGGSWLPAGRQRSTDAKELRALVPDIAEHDVYVCGPDHWMAAVRDTALATGVPPERIHLERFSW